ncbi:hypothetical protein, partial [Photobacterium carnosum]|uniref:hypothetical protein n=1 Tax=Photobacterium carnosum TaxID=2023717 RepID=UPI001E2F96A4
MAESAALPINATPLDHNNTDVKKPHITIEAFLNMAEVTRFELPSRADFRYGGICCSASKNYIHKLQIAKRLISFDISL